MTPARNSLCLGIFQYFAGKGSPKHKEFTGSGLLRGGGVQEEGSGEILYIYAFLQGLTCGTPQGFDKLVLGPARSAVWKTGAASAVCARVAGGSA